MSRRSTIRIVVLLMGGVAAFWLLTVTRILLAGERPELRPADAIIVLGAAQYNGRPSPVFKARLDHAIMLYRAGLADRLVLTGGVGVGDTVSEGEVARRYVLSRGLVEAAILVEREGLTSAESISAAAGLMREQDLKSALLVSDPFHMLRLELLARRSGIDAHRAPVPSSPISRSPLEHWRFILRESLIYPMTLFMSDPPDLEPEGAN